jgi:hypothetical protein
MRKRSIFASMCDVRPILTNLKQQGVELTYPRFTEQPRKPVWDRQMRFAASAGHGKECLIGRFYKCMAVLPMQDFQS